MLSLIASPNCFTFNPRLVGDLKFRAISWPLVVVFNPRRARRPGRRCGAACFDLDYCSLRFGNLRRRQHHYEGSWVRGCKGWENDGDLALEAEILEFMKNSEKPGIFPTKKELMDEGRMDLVDAIVKQGGWLSMGWELDNEKEDKTVQEIERTVGESENGALLGGGTRDFQHRVEEGNQESNPCGGVVEVMPSEISPISANSTESPSSSGGSLEMEGNEATGIQGILKRLEEQRNLSFGVNLGKNTSADDFLNEYDGYNLRTGNWIDADRVNNNNEKLSHEAHERFVSEIDSSRDPPQPQSWRMWSIQRAGFSDAEFEAAEISFSEDGNGVQEGNDAQKDDILAITENANAAHVQENISHTEIRARLQQLELVLSSTLHSLRSNSKEVVSQKVGEASPVDLQKVSDAWEFQENEIMNAQDKLRSIRAKLVVLEGKMALAIIDAQKMVSEKQKKVDGARKALQLVRTTCIVWPNSASEVLVAGSFDGWTTQRKMEKSSTGVFSLWLKLYPGKYEIKFIVDGEWRIDPLRPIVDNNGYKNNLLIIT